MTHQWICILSEDLEEALLAATLYRLYTLKQPVKPARQRARGKVILQLTLEKPESSKSKKQCSHSRAATPKKPRTKSVKCDGEWKIVLQQFVK
jgi:hypothetical protein